ncbi:hypothetical protein [Streptomyces sp. KL118A]|uniref:hypothetical protein n=1 Tax=Streptomyces sp. KL118A TaxID=3045153 RepID=UPI00278BD25D|nr:hypothetical protein [Streptomyces sp. KL118A]
MTAPPAPTAPPEQPAPPAPPPVRARIRVRTPARTAGCTITTDGSYAARLARAAGAPDSWYPERWTLGSAEPFAVPLPGNQPEEPSTEVLPMADGRVLVHRVVGERHVFTLLYPTGPGTGEVPLGAVECGELTLLPPAPGGTRAYALAPGARSSDVWLVAGGAFGPEHLAAVPGRCSGGVWLDGTDRLLALDRELDGRTKTVAVDLERDGEVSPLLQIAEDSDDRLLLADAGSGLLLLRSDAPGDDRLGWGVLGGTRPVRFPESLRLPDLTVTPFATQPGQVLTPEACGVALRIDGPAAGGGGSWLGLWRPAARQVQQVAAPAGWLTGSGWWTRDGELCLPYATGAAPCGVARMTVPPTPTAAEPARPEDAPHDASHDASHDVSHDPSRATAPDADGDLPHPSQPPPPDPRMPAATRPVPLQQAPLGGRTAGS